MLKRIKLIQDYYDHNGDNIIGQEFDAILVEDKNTGNLNANFDVGGDYSFGTSNIKDMDPAFEILGDIGSPNKDADIARLKSDLAAQEDIVAMAKRGEADKTERIQELEDELYTIKNQKQEIKREILDGGYVILPTKWLDEQLANEFKGNEDHIITPKEIVAMCASAQLEINKGDVRPTSLNVKLYNAINDFAQDELDSMIEAGKSGQA